MSEIEILEQNPNKLANLLSKVLTANECKKIVDVGRRHTKELMKLSYHHLVFAKRISTSANWRQKVSRAYYSCYTASKAVRLAIQGAYSQEGKDHQKVGNLPSDFPKQSYWANLLVQFRSDRNLADYDHDKRSKNLNKLPRNYVDDAEMFYKEAYKYLKGKGVF